jgi:hypothetical protein
VQVEIKPAATQNKVKFITDNSCFTTKIGTLNSSGLGDLTVSSTCGNKVESALKFEVDGLSDVNNQIKLVSYQSVIKSVAFILVHEENDDVQSVNIGLSTPNSKTIVVQWGNNQFLDTNPTGDDQIITDPTTGETVIIAGANNICDTKVNNTNIVSTDYNRATIKQWFEDYYGKSIITWNVDLTVNTCLVNFDLNKDGKVDVSSANWNTPEMVIIENKCKINSSDYNLFFVNNPDDGSSGFMGFPSQQLGTPIKFGFIHVDVSPYTHTTCAHELGHGAFSLHHPFVEFTPCFPKGKKDVDNIMNYGNNRNKFRKYQWDLMH